jgi:hypothetical protein
MHDPRPRLEYQMNVLNEMRELVELFKLVVLMHLTNCNIIWNSPLFVRRQMEKRGTWDVILNGSSLVLIQLLCFFYIYIYIYINGYNFGKEFPVVTAKYSNCL